MQTWEVLTADEYEAVWTRFDLRFDFRPSTTSWPGFREPADSVTYHVGHVYGDPERYQRLTLDLCRRLLTALRRCVAPNAFVHVLDWQHESYRFYPHVPFEFESEADWRVPPLPNGDYYIFVDPELAFGVLGHPWEQSMCVFGARLLDAVAHHMPALFDRPIRSGGRAMGTSGRVSE